MKLGVFILCHHKQWLLKSTLLTFLQKNIKNYELNFVLILGSGKKKENFLTSNFLSLTKICWI